MRGAGLVFASVLFVGLAAGPLVAQVTVEANETPLDVVLSRLGEQAGERILLAPSAEGNLTCKLTSSTAQEALDVICSTLGLECRKIHIRLADGETLTGSDLEDMVSALERIERPGIVVEGTRSEPCLVFAQGESPPADLTSAALGGRSPEIIYLVRAPSGANVTPKRAPKVADLVEMEKARILAQSGLSVQEQDELARRSADLFFSLDPGVRNNVVMDRLRMMANMTPDQRRQMREIVSGAWQNMPQDLRQRLEGTAGWRGQDGQPPRE